MIKIFLKHYENGTHVVEKITLNDKIISQFNEKDGKINFKPLFDLQKQYDEALLITSYENLGKVKENIVKFNVTKEEKYIININDIEETI